MSERNWETQPYSKEEQRVSDYIQELTQNAIGSGDDPIGFLIASHRGLVAKTHEATKMLLDAGEALNHAETQIRRLKTTNLLINEALDRVKA